MSVITFDNESAYIESNPTSIITKESGNTLIDIAANINSGFTFHSGLKADVESGKFSVGDFVFETDTGCISCVDHDGNRVLIDIPPSFYDNDGDTHSRNDTLGELEELKCTNCSSPLKMIPGSSICTCDYCGSTYRFK